MGILRISWCTLGKLSKTTKRIFSVKGGVYPPFPRRVFGQGDFPLRGEGGTPNSVKENSAKKQIFLATEAQLGLIGLASPSSVGWRSSTTLSGSRLAINKN